MFVIMNVSACCEIHVKGKLIYRSIPHFYVQCSKKETLHSATWPEFPQMQNYDRNTLVQKQLSHINGKKLFCLFWGGKFRFCFLSTIYSAKRHVDRKCGFQRTFFGDPPNDFFFGDPPNVFSWRPSEQIDQRINFL